MKKAKTLTEKTKSWVDVIQTLDLLSGKTQIDPILLELKHIIYTFEELSVKTLPNQLKNHLINVFVKKKIMYFPKI